MAAIKTWATDGSGHRLDPVRVVAEPWPLIVDVPLIGYVALIRAPEGWRARHIAYDSDPRRDPLDGTARPVAEVDGRVEIDVVAGQIVLVVEGADRG